MIPLASLVDRATAKVGPLPVWAWALVLLVGGYLVYRFTGIGSSSSSSSSSSPPPDTGATSTDPASALDTTPIGGDSGNPPASGQGGAADNLSGDLYSYLTGIQGSVDSLTAAVQMAPGFWDTSSSGSGSVVPNSGAGAPTAPTRAPVKAAPKPAPKPAAPAHVRYYTYAPGKAPKGQTANQAPAKGPAGTVLRFAKGKGYYYA